MSNCPAALNIEGEHFACDLSAPHSGLAHSSRAAQAAIDVIAGLIGGDAE